MEWNQIMVGMKMRKRIIFLVSVLALASMIGCSRCAVGYPTVYYYVAKSDQLGDRLQVVAEFRGWNLLDSSGYLGRYFEKPDSLAVNVWTFGLGDDCDGSADFPNLFPMEFAAVDSAGKAIYFHRYEASDAESWEKIPFDSAGVTPHDESYGVWVVPPFDSSDRLP